MNENATAAARARVWIDLLLSQFPELLAELAPGRSARPASAPRGPARTGGSAPVRLHVSDAVRDITDGVVELEEAVLERLGRGRPRKARVPERLRRIAALLDRVGEDEVLAEHVLSEVRRMARRCGRALGEAEPLVRVAGRCPWCDSVSLRAFPARRAVLCVNPGCRCGNADCGCGAGTAYRHTWPEAEWAVLAERAGVALETLAAAAGEAR
ncbi:hypothetical protein AB0K09_11775 [Streptomyces sp. NPDC049577]|uniref:hypothetical protein n=1 Tax=Streptomyces sp. NPDC049577 TaxID=3155153 RepID=UPI003424806F